MKFEILFFNPNFYINFCSQFFISVGTETANSFGTGSNHPVEKFIIHENYNEITFENDIALLKIEKPIAFSKEVQPICLPEKDYGTNGDYECEVSGFGLIKETGNVITRRFYD